MEASQLLQNDRTDAKDTEDRASLVDKMQDKESSMMWETERAVLFTELRKSRKSMDR